MEIGYKAPLGTHNNYAPVKQPAAGGEPVPSFTDVLNNQLRPEKGLGSFGPNVPYSVQQAWSQAANQTGANGLGIGTNGMMTHIPAALVLQAEQRMTTGNSDLFGSSVSSAKNAAENILSRLNNPLAPESNAKIHSYQEQEKQFYMAFLHNLASNGTLDGHA